MRSGSNLQLLTRKPHLLNSLLASKSTAKSLLTFLFSLSTAAFLYLLYFIISEHQRRSSKKKDKMAQALKEAEAKVQVILKELQIEAHFTLSVAHLKYKDKQVQNKERKRQQIQSEFAAQVVAYYLIKNGLS